MNDSYRNDEGHWSSSKLWLKTFARWGATFFRIGRVWKINDRRGGKKKKEFWGKICNLPKIWIRKIRPLRTLFHLPDSPFRSHLKSLWNKLRTSVFCTKIILYCKTLRLCVPCTSGSTKLLELSLTALLVFAPSLSPPPSLAFLFPRHLLRPFAPLFAQLRRAYESTRHFLQ